LFPFGHGLSYTQFEYSDLDIRPERGGLEVSFFVENSGSVKGAEVPQVYVGPSSEPIPVQAAVQKLVGFERIELGPGEKRKITLRVSRRELSYWSTEEQRWVLPQGERSIFVGGSSRDSRLQGQSRVESN
jgi:beta-glucosidase